MSQPYVGEIRLFAGNFAPQGWMFCQGQLLPISEFETLFNLIGTTYGGDGQSTFGLPDLRGRIALHQGNGFTLAETGGAESVTLNTAQIPGHSHQQMADSNTATSTNPSGMVPAAGPEWYTSALPPSQSMNANALNSAGGNQPHENLVPYVAMCYIISLFGVFPSQT